MEDHAGGEKEESAPVVGDATRRLERANKGLEEEEEEEVSFNSLLPPTPLYSK